MFAQHKTKATKVAIFLLVLGSISSLGVIGFLSRTKAAGINYYIDSTAGSDTNDGRTENTPWQSLTKVQTEESAGHFLPGDSINFKRGSSFIGQLSMYHSGYRNGSTFSPITLQAYGIGAAPVFTNPSPNNTSAKILFLQGSNIVVDGLELNGTILPANGSTGAVSDTANGIYIYQGSYNVIKNLTVKGVGEGIVIEGNNNFVTSNTISNLGMVVNSSASNNDDYGAIGILLSGSQNEVSYNTITNCKAVSSDYGADGGAIEFYSKVSVNNNYIHHNSARDNEGFAEIGGQSSSTVSNNTISYNVLDNNSRLFYFNLSGTFASNVSGMNLYNNDIIETGTSASYPQLIVYSQQPSNNIVNMENNIFYITSPISSVSNYSNSTHTYNIYKLPTGTQLGFTPDATEILGDPLFTDVSARDYILQATSPALDNAASLGTITDYLGTVVPLQSVDFVGTSVPQNSIPDRGVYERVGTAPTQTPTPTASPSPSPSLSPTPTKKHGR